MNQAKARTRSLLAALALLLAASPVWAQLADERSEAEVAAFELEEEEERQGLLEEAQRGPEAQASWFAEDIDMASQERTDTAIATLRRLVEDTPRGDSMRAEYMFRLAELFYQRARFFEQRAFTRRDEAFTIRDENPARARAFEQRAADDLQQSDQFAEQAIDLYVQIYEDHGDTYDDIDAVLFFLGANLSQLGRMEQARDVFEVLVQQYPRSVHVPGALLALGEYYFLQGEMHAAYDLFSAVAEFRDRSFAYATYKQAWSLYNIGESEGDFEAAVELLLVAIDASQEQETSGNVRLRRDALRDMTLFYSEVFPANMAFPFFEEVAPDQYEDLVERLAMLYGERGMYADSSLLLNELIRRNQDSFRIVDWQREIVRNARPASSEAEMVREVRRLVELFNVARSFPDATEASVAQTEGRIELLLRQLATTYHREAQVTRNDELYALAFNLYEDYARNFGDSEHAYLMWFYYAELLYRNEDWGDAAAAYERALSASPGGDQGLYDGEATHAACLAYTRMVDLSRTDAVTSGGQAAAQEEDLPPVPEPQEIPEEYLRMMDACDRYLAMNPDEEAAVEIDYVVAFMYYDFDHLDEAVPRFGELASRFAGVDLLRAQIAAELMLDSLALKRDYGAMRHWIGVFREGPLNQGEFGDRLEMLSEQISFRECRVLQEQEQHDEAAHCFVTFVEGHPRSDLVDGALYNAGISFESVDNIDFAISVYSALIQMRPDSELVPDTVYELARTYHRLAIYDEAARRYREYVSIAPEGEHVVDALINASQFLHGLGQYDEALRVLQQFVTVARRSPDVDAAAIAEAHYQMALIEEERGRAGNAIAAFERFVSDHGRTLPSRSVEASGRIAVLNAERGRDDRAMRTYRDIVGTFEATGDEERAQLSSAALDTVARAHFMIGEEVFDRFEAVPLNQRNEAQQQEALRQKIAYGAEAAQVFDRVLDYGRPGWAIASLTRLGRLYHVFFEQLIDAPIPTGMSPLEEEVYRQGIEEQAIVYRDDAILRYSRAIELARQSGWFNEYSFQAARLMQELDPSFRAGIEIRVEPGHDSLGYYSSGMLRRWDGEIDYADEAEAAPAGGDVPAEEASLEEVSRAQEVQQ